MIVPYEFTNASSFLGDENADFTAKCQVFTGVMRQDQFYLITEGVTKY